MVERQSISDPGSAVVARELELLETELAHQPDLVTGHGPLGVEVPGDIGSGWKRGAT